MQTVVISNLCLDLVSKLVIVTGLMVDLFEYHSTSFPLSEIRIAAFSPAEKFQDAIVFSIYREYLRHLFLISVFLTHNSIHPLAPIMPDTASDVTGFHRNISILFGYFIDLTMVMLFFVNPQTYLSSVVYLLIGCVILGFGVYTEVLANVAMLPGESFVRAVSSTWKTEFGSTKVAFDVSLTVIAAVLSLLFAHRLDGVREGTIIAALLVGFIARLFGRWLTFLEPLLFRNGKSGKEQTGAVSAGDSVSADAAAPHTVIVIGRQYGSGGHDIGKELAGKLGFAFYDNEIIQMTAGSTGYTPKFVQEHEENMTNSFLYDLVSQMYIYSDTQEAPRDAIFESEGKVIRSLADQENCVILGRCADYFLRERPNCLKVYLHAPEDYRVKRIMDTENLSEEDARQKVRRMDRRRSDNYHYYTRRIWGHSKNYDLTIDTSIGAEAVEEIIRRTLELREKQKITD